MMKRKPKHNAKGRAQLPAKRLKPAVEVELTQELREQVKGQNDYAADTGNDDANEMVTAGKNEGKEIRRPKQTEKKLSKKQLKRLRKILEKKEKKSGRAGVLESLAEHTISQEHANLLTKTSSMSKKLSAKQTLRQQLKEERAGIRHLIEENASEGSGKRVRLNVARKAKIEVEESEEGSEEDSADEEESDEGDADTNGVTATEQEEPIKVAEPKDLPEKSKPKPKAPVVPAVYIPINRSSEIQSQRLQLPILAEEHTIMEAIEANNIVVACGETGSGKTTQVPQFLYERGYAHKGKDKHMLIGITEPRRIAAVAMASRVANELGLTDRQVSYQIRYKRNVTSDTRIKFMTDGVLQKEIESDFALRKYSVIIVDEAHERSMHTDILLGLLSRIIPLREKMHKENPEIPVLKLIIMSATLRIDDFTKNERLFPSTVVPVVKIDARQYPVTTHFSKRTREDDMVNTAFMKTCQIHRRLPPGGILIFVTGQSEIFDLCRRLQEKFPRPNNEGKVTHAGMGERDAEVWEDCDGELSDLETDMDDSESDSDSDSSSSNSDGAGEKKKSSKMSSKKAVKGAQPLHVLPLFANLATDKQAKVFDAIPEGARLCVVATNVAETSLTIPGIRYVVDTGQVKSISYDDTTGVHAFNVGWTSKASAAQRTGRAGRTGPGHCYRLYSSAVFQHEFANFSDPEICRVPVDGLVLQMKSMGIDTVVNFPFPTPPDRTALHAAEKILVHLNALDKSEKKITPIGKTMSRYPIAPRYAKMLTLAQHYDSLPYVMAIVAALTVRDLFEHTTSGLDEDEEEDDDPIMRSKKSAERKKALQAWKMEGISGGGDLAAMLHAIGACDYERRCKRNISDFCDRMKLRYKAIAEVDKLRAQLARTADMGLSGVDLDDGDDAGVTAADCIVIKKPPTESQRDAVRQIILAGFGDHVARLSPNQGDPARGYMYTCDSVEEPVFIHPQSVLYGHRVEYVVYHALYQGKTRLYMKGVTVIQPEWLPRLVPSLCVFSKPMEEPAPYYDEKRDEVRCYMSASFGKSLWPIRAQELLYPDMPERYRYFARFLLEGKVIPALAAFTPHLLNKPAIMNKPWVKERVVAMLQTLVDAKVDSKAKLITKWKEDSKFLLGPMVMWLDSSKHGDLAAIWPPVSV